MPFDEEDDVPSTQSKKIGLKNVSTQKSIFDSIPKKPTQEELDRKVNTIQERASGHKVKAAELALQFNKSMMDKTLKTNKTIFSSELEKELLTRMIQLAIEINDDPAEQNDMGSLSWITLLLRTCFYQRDRINDLEYTLSQIDKKMDTLISTKITQALDKKKASE